MKKVITIPIAKPLIGEDEALAVANVLSSGVLAHGKTVDQFEEAFAEYIGTRFAVAVNSGTAALHLALLAHEIEAGDEVITTPFSFIATANSIIYTGAKPVFVDVEEASFNIDPARIKEKITPRTRAIMPVHLYGQPCDMDSIMNIAREHNLVVIEDACQAHGAEYKGKMVGSLGTGCFSFYPTKNMTTGEGGIITTDDPEIAERVKMLRNHGQRERYNHVMGGFNCRMTNIGAAIGLCQLRRLDQFNAQRISNANLLARGLASLKGIIPPYVAPNVTHVFHQFTIRVTREYILTREALRERLGENGVGTEIYYPVPIHLQPYYRELGYNESYPVAEQAAREVLSLPVHPGVKEDEIARILKAFY